MSHIKMVKTAMDPALEGTTAAIEATQRADSSKSEPDVSNAIAEWEAIIQKAGPSEDEVFMYSSYARLLITRWHISRRAMDLDAGVTNLDKTINNLSYAPSQQRYDLLVALASTIYDRYAFYKNSDDLLRSIQLWEEVNGLSLALRRSQDSVTCRSIQRVLII
jgi:hypothetical protein